jgi:hypothetical protein
MIAPPTKVPRADPPADPPSSADAAIEKLAALLIEMREDVRVLTARLDRLDPVAPPAGEWLPLKRAAALCGTAVASYPVANCRRSSRRVIRPNRVVSRAIVKRQVRGPQTARSSFEGKVAESKIDS